MVLENIRACPCFPSIFIALSAALLDFAVGDPPYIIHPVQVMGWFIVWYRKWVWKSIPSPQGQRLAGVVLGIGLPLISGALAAGMVILAGKIHTSCEMTTAIVLIASSLAARSLRRAAEEVMEPLSRGDLSMARTTLSMYVSRDTDKLTKAEILRAVMETISENATDGVTSPLFYALLGISISPAFGVAFAFAYKALSTLDSMVGYLNPPYRHLGWWSARSEDWATWLPCRLTVFTICILSGEPMRVWSICSRDAPADPSPNAGWSECVYVAALGVQVGGLNIYKGISKRKPHLGDALRPISYGVINEGLQLTRWTIWVWLTIWCLLQYAFGCKGE